MKIFVVFAIFTIFIYQGISAAPGLLSEFDQEKDDIIGHVFPTFPQKQVAEFKKAFQFMDEHYGIIGKNDLRATFDAVGKLTNDKELEEILGEASGPIDFTQLLTLFANRMVGLGATGDEVVIDAFRKFDVDGFIDGQIVVNLLMNFVISSLPTK